MKLIFCKSCHDVQRLIVTTWRTCECKESGGQYNNEITATVTIGGNCLIFGIPNPFFNEVSFYIRDDARQWFRDTYGPYGNDDIWWGGKLGDFEVFKIESGLGPKLKMKATKEDNFHTLLTFQDKRDYVISGQKNIPFIVVNTCTPSLKLSKNKK